MLANAESMSYSVSTITQCDAPTGVTVIPKPSKVAPGEVVTVTMPQCPVCVCDNDCIHTRTYTTALEVICPTGVATQTWTVEEIYSGMSELPTVVTTGCPPGFTTTVTECPNCDTVTKTITYPNGGQPSITAAPGNGGNKGNNTEMGGKNNGTNNVNMGGHMGGNKNNGMGSDVPAVTGGASVVGSALLWALAPVALLFSCY